MSVDKTMVCLAGNCSVGFSREISMSTGKWVDLEGESLFGTSLRVRRMGGVC